MNQDSIFKLTSITTLDGRYRKKTEPLSEHLSEYALIKTRLTLEIKYLIFLSTEKQIRKLINKELSFLIDIYDKFSIKDALKIKQFEEKTRHDVKAIEKYLIVKFKNTSLNDISEFIHIYLTSEDINNLAYRLMLKNALEQNILLKLKNVNKMLREISYKNKKTYMLARTHGQPAVPTTFGKEIFVFYKRLEKEIKFLQKDQLTGKLNGAVGNFNSFYFVKPKNNWVKLSDKFIKSLGFVPNRITTQINPFEDIIYVLQTLQRVNGILIDANQDLWRYISDNLLKLAVKKYEVGSSTMPQKVNPIDFENSEGNLIMANGVVQTMIEKLYISRLQRDLSNSTVIRNLGTAIGFCLLGYDSFFTGLSRIDVDKEKMFEQLNSDWSILAEGLQIYLRSKGFKDSYFFVSRETKGKKFNENTWKELINSLKIPESDKQNLLKLTPKNYIGIADKLAY